MYNLPKKICGFSTIIFGFGKKFNFNQKTNSSAEKKSCFPKIWFLKNKVSQQKKKKVCAQKIWFYTDTQLPPQKKCSVLQQTLQLAPQKTHGFTKKIHIYTPQNMTFLPAKKYRVPQRKYGFHTKYTQFPKQIWVENTSNLKKKSNSFKKRKCGKNTQKIRKKYGPHNCPPCIIPFVLSPLQTC